MCRRLLLALLALIGAVTVAAGTAAWVTLRRWDAEVSERFRSHRWRFA